MREPVSAPELVTLDDMYFMHYEFGAEFVLEDGTIVEIIRRGEGNVDR